ncbi:MAG: (Fe-S)-binding protein, partial [Desulfobacterales bacterium]|nr:(Fe-S)-binding protein [Desulfobacterales bacterium]
TGILMHAVRLAGWPMGTYVMYVIHLAVAVPMLVIEVPFGKWSHLFYRPLAMFLSAVKEKATSDSKVDPADVLAEVGDNFLSCLQCGTCTSACPWNRVSSFSPRRILRQLNLDAGTELDVDQAVWSCVTCNACGALCPRGIDIVDVMKAVRGRNVVAGRIPESIETPLISLEKNGNPWRGDPGKRVEWAEGLDIPEFARGHEYCLFTCCTTAYDPGAAKAGRALPQLLREAAVSFGSLGAGESCCGDPARALGAGDLFAELSQRNAALFLRAGVGKIVTTSPHCLDAFKKDYPDLKGRVDCEHYTELLARLIEEGRLTPTRGIDQGIDQETDRETDCVVTFHDPCYLGRHNGVYDAPRRVLQSIPGLTLVEMFNAREGSACCGGGGGGAWRDAPSSRGESLAAARVQEAMSAGAGVIATACPYCIRILNQAVAEMGVGDRIVVRDLAELLWQSVERVDETASPGRVEARSDQEVCHV